MSFVQSMAMARDQPSAGWGLCHWHFVGDTPCPSPSGVAGLSQAGGAGDGSTSWLNTAAREGIGCLQGPSVASGGLHISWGQRSVACCSSRGLVLQDARWRVVKEQERAAYASSTGLGLGSLQYHSRFVQALPTAPHGTAVFRLPVWLVVKSQSDVSSKVQKYSENENEWRWRPKTQAWSNPSKKKSRSCTEG